MKHRRYWQEIPQEAQIALEYWYNVAQYDWNETDYRILTDLYFSGRFKYWRCPECNKLVTYGNPVNWDRFQGVMQPDYTSYPGNTEKYTQEYIARMCDDCRMKW